MPYLLSFMAAVDKVECGAQGVAANHECRRTAARGASTRTLKIQGVADATARPRQGEGAEGALGVAAGGRLLAESQLRALVTPDQWCAHEAMRAGRLRLAAAGVAKHERLAALPPERLRVAAEQLAPAPVRPLIRVTPAQRCSNTVLPGCHQRCSQLCWRGGGEVQCCCKRECHSCFIVFGPVVG